MSDAANFPKSVPINKPNQFQKDLFPFSAFSSDDPNKTANPRLILDTLWTLVGTFSGIGTALTNAIVNTAANLASSNPVLLAGQIGYETNTISFKLGNGTTAYNSLTYAYRGLPVAGESSLGTPHPHEYNFYTNGTLGGGETTLNAVTLAGLPAGTTMIYVSYEHYVGAGGRVNIRDMASHECVRGINGTTANGYLTGNGIVKLDSSGQFKVYSTGATGANFQLDMHEYWI